MVNIMGDIRCVFKPVNGDNTGAFARTGMGMSYSSVGVLYMRNCPSRTFYCDDTDGGTNNYYLLKNPTSYGLPNQKLYICLSTSYLSVIDFPAKEPTPSPEPAQPATEEASTPTLDIDDKPSFKYSQGLDDMITELMKQNRNLSLITENTRVIGAPYQFLPSADNQPFEEMDIGRKYLENILAEAPIVNFVPGLPRYLPDFGADDKYVLENAFNARTSGEELSDDVMKKLLNEEGRYFDFRAAYSDYMKYVNLLCRMSAIYMGIADEIVPGTNQRYRYFSWNHYTNFNANHDNSFDTDENGQPSVWDNIIEKANEIGAELFGDYRYLKCYVDPNASFNESASNSTSQSTLAGIFDTVEGLGKDIAFLSGGNDGKSFVAELGQNIKSAVDNITDSIDSSRVSNLSKIIGMAAHTISGSNIIFPEIWGDASFSKSYQFTINLVSPYGDPESIFLNIIMPMMHLIALGLPRQTSANSFTSPFLVKVFCKGWFSCELGMVDSISIEKGGNGDAWSVSGLPTEAKVTLSVKDLYSNLMITKTTNPSLFFNNQGLIEFLSVTCGMDIREPNLITKLETIINSIFSNLYDIPKNAYNSFIESIRNKVNELIQLTRI